MILNNKQLKTILILIRSFQSLQIKKMYKCKQINKVHNKKNQPCASKIYVKKNYLYY